jgi:restriction system protein
MITHFEGEPRWAQFFVGRDDELANLKTVFDGVAKTAAIIVADRGAGKTSLLKVFEEGAGAALYPSGITYTRATPFWSDMREGAPKRPVRSKALWIVDQVESMEVEALARLTDVFHSEPLLSMLLASTRRLDLPIRDLREINLAPLSLADFQALLLARAKATNVGDIEQFWRSVGGNASMAEFAGKTIREGLLTWEKLLSGIQGFDRAGLVGPDGQPISASSTEGNQIISDIYEVNDQLLEIAKTDPSVVYSLGPRKFEELIAELLMRQGYETQLTPSSKDGGFDIYAARKESLGEILFLVECKKYAADRKVGVEIVRALHGVVQEKRATAGVVATTSFFTKGALAFQQKIVHQMHLADYVALQKWLHII